MTTKQTNAVHRIERERSACAGKVRTRLIARAATLATETRRTGEIRSDAFVEAIQRQAMLAYLRGMKRTVHDATAAIGRDVRVAHYNLDRKQDEDEDDDKVLLWLIAFLMLGAGQLELIRSRSQRVAQAASRELVNPAARRIVQDVAQYRADAATNLTPKRGGFGKTDAQTFGGRVYEATPGKTEVASDLDIIRRVTGPAFDRAGIGKGSRHNIDTWAETIAYTEYEAGRNDANTIFPAISNALWGYRYSAILDTRTTVTCRSLDGFIASLDDPYMRDLIPPLHFGCRSVRIPVYMSSALSKPPTPFRPASLTDATLQRYIAKRAEFVRRLA